MSLLTDYVQQLKQLLPRGDLWSSLQQDETFTNLLEAEAEEKVRIHLRANNLIEETDPRTTYELLLEWEAFAGLPDTCSQESGSLDQRRTALHNKLTMLGGQSKAYFISLAAAYGFIIDIEEFDARTVNSDVDTPYYDERWRYAWRVLAPSVSVHEKTVNSDVDTPYRYWGNELLECIIKKYKPAHTYVLFSYEEQ